MTIKELLLDCDIEKAAEWHYNFQEEPRIEDWEHFLNLHRQFLQEIQKITPVCDDYLMMLYVSESNGETRIEIGFYHKSELMATFKRHINLEGFWDIDNLKHNRRRFQEVKSCLTSDIRCDSYDLETMPWELILGAEVFEKNVERCPKEIVVARLIQKMTFFGFAREQSAEGQRTVMSVIREGLTEVAHMENLALEDLCATKAPYTIDSISLDYACTRVSEYRAQAQYVLPTTYWQEAVLYVCTGVAGAGKTTLAPMLSRFCGPVYDVDLNSEKGLDFIRKKRCNGWLIHLIYTGLDTLEEHLQRIKNHADPACVQAQLHNRWIVLDQILPLCREVSFYELNPNKGFLGSYRDGQLLFTEAGTRSVWLREWQSHHFG